MNASCEVVALCPMLDHGLGILVALLFLLLIAAVGYIGLWACGPEDEETDEQFIERMKREHSRD